MRGQEASLSVTLREALSGRELSHHRIYPNSLLFLVLVLLEWKLLCNMVLFSFPFS